jgi:hypothetical protein
MQCADVFKPFVIYMRQLPNLQVLQLVQHCMRSDAGI